jgi:DNA repair protein RadC
MMKKPLNEISEIKLIYTRKVTANERPKVTCSQDAYGLFKENWNDLTINLFEEFKILLLDRDNRCMGIVSISQGGVSGTVVDAKLVFAAALKARACALILGHNHPSGNLKASQQDRSLTDKLINGGRCLDIPILDHIVMSDEDYFSFADSGIIASYSP